MSKTFEGRRIVDPVNLAWLGTLVIIISLTLSRAGMSIGMGLVLVGAAWQVLNTRSLKPLWDSPFPLLLSLVWLFAVATGLWTTDQAGWEIDVRVKLPFLLIPLALCLIPRFSSRQIYVLGAAFVLTQCLVGIFSVYKYLF